MQINPKNVLTAILVVAVTFVLWLRWDVRPRVEQMSADIQQVDTSGWVTLSDEVHGLRIKVPAAVTAYTSPDNAAGCDQALIFGIPGDNDVSLMAEHQSCAPDAPSNRNVGAFQGDQDTHISILPVNSADEITGFIKGRIVENPLLTGSLTNPDDRACLLRSLHATLGAIDPNNINATAAVNLTGNGCSVNGNLLTARYSPHFKKLVVFEAAYAAAEGGNYYLSGEADGKHLGVDQSIYATAEVYR